jgi:hypothetical protein
VNQFVGEQPLPRRVLGLILPCAENDVPADGVSARVDGLGRLGRFPIVVHTHIAEVPTEARLDKGAGCGIQRLAR